MEAERLHEQFCNNEKVSTAKDIKLCTEMLIAQKDAVKGWAKYFSPNRHNNNQEKPQILLKKQQGQLH
jgi:hypothetical protein